MAKNLSYKKQQSLTLKATGVIDIENMSIEIGDECKSIKSLLRDFDGCETALTLQVKSDEELDDPSDE